MFLDVFKHLLPKAKAWNITIDKQLRQFFDGLTIIGDLPKTFIDTIYFDLFPQTVNSSRELALWEEQFGLLSNSLTIQERRDRLAAAWQAQGGQSPRYIQDTLQANGFNVFIHEWFEPDTNPPVLREPLDFLRVTTGDPIIIPECGEAVAECGEADAICGNSLELTGFALVNKIQEIDSVISSLAGEAFMECGESQAICGNFSIFEFSQKIYTIPNDPLKWPFFLYIGAETFPDIETIGLSRQNEFEALLLKICPAQQWLGLLIKYQ